MDGRTMRHIVAALLVVAPVEAVAQTSYPERPIQLVVGFPAGSISDLVARLLAQKLTESLGKPIVVENVAGGAGNIATGRVAKAAPDGYTLALTSSTQIIMNPSLYHLPFDPVKDFAPITQLAASSNILVVPNAAPMKTFQELVALAEAQPGAFTYASGGTGSTPHISSELLNSAAGLDIRHIPYKGVVLAIPDLLAGRVTMVFSPISVVLPTVREGKLRALAVTSLTRSSAVPDLPTVDESGLPGEVDDAPEHAALEAALGVDGEEPLHGVEPTSRGGLKVERPPRMADVRLGSNSAVLLQRRGQQLIPR